MVVEIETGSKNATDKMLAFNHKLCLTATATIII